MGIPRPCCHFLVVDEVSGSPSARKRCLALQNKTKTKITQSPKSRFLVERKQNGWAGRAR